MTKNKLFAWAITLLCFSLTSCSDEKDGPSEKILVTNAGVTEANQTVKPGDIVHILPMFLCVVTAFASLLALVPKMIRCWRR